MCVGGQLRRSNLLEGLDASPGWPAELTIRYYVPGNEVHMRCQAVPLQEHPQLRRLHTET